MKVFVFCIIPEGGAARREGGGKIRDVCSASVVTESVDDLKACAGVCAWLKKKQKNTTGRCCSEINNAVNTYKLWQCFVPKQPINISISGGDENWVCYQLVATCRCGEMTHFGKSASGGLFAPTLADWLPFKTNGRIFCHARLGSCDLMVIQGGLMALRLHCFCSRLVM